MQRRERGGRRQRERQQDRQQHHAPVEETAPPLPFFFGASTRKRARELLFPEGAQGDLSPQPQRPDYGRHETPKGGGKGDDYDRKGARNGKARNGKGFGRGDDFDRAHDRAPPHRQQQHSQWAPAMPAEGMEVKWLTLGGENSPLVEAGLNAEAPVLSWTKELNDSGLFTGMENLLQALVEDAEVEVHHDSECKDFPEVCAALQVLEIEEVSYCLAVCPAKCLWGVGVAGKWKRRESAAKLALCMQLARETPAPSNLLQPGFQQFCELAGVTILTTGGEEPEPVEEEPPRKQWQQRRSNRDRDAERGPPQRDTAGWKQGLPRDKPVWICLPTETMEDTWPDIIKSMPPDTVAVATDGKRRARVYSQAEEILPALTHDSLESIKYVDDAGWEQFPMVGAALQGVAEKEECMTVVFFDLLNVWAVGVSMQKKNRERAAKVALATVLAIQAEETGDVVDYAEMEDFRQFVEEAKNMREEFMRAQDALL